MLDDASLSTQTGRTEAAAGERLVGAAREAGGGRLSDAVRRDPGGRITRMLATVAWTPTLEDALALARPTALRAGGW